MRNSPVASRMSMTELEDNDMAVSEEDVAKLCKMEIWTVKSIIRPDTMRIRTSFDKMMNAVKRRSSQRHQDVNTAIERCFTAFSGRGKNLLIVNQFARRLSVLSMEWSGNFSKEEYLALAQDLSEEDTPGVVTLESFMFAAKNGAMCLPSRCREKGDESSNRSTLARDSSQEGNHGCHVDEFDDEAGDRRGLGARTARDAEGGVTATEDTLETTLQQAAVTARAKGHDVWTLLDACIQAALEEAQSDEDDRTPNSENVAAQTHLSPEVVHLFFSKLDVRVVPSISSAPSPSSPPLREAESTTGEQPRQEEEQQQPDEQAAASRSPQHRAHDRCPSFEHREGAGEAAAASSFLSVRNAFEARSSGSREGSPVRRNASPTPPSSSSPQFAPARDKFEETTKSAQDGQTSVKSEAPAASSPPSQEAPSVCDRYLRALSRDTASVRCRVQFYNQELARTLQEAETLVSRGAAKNINNSESFQKSSLLSPDIDGSAAARRGVGGGGGESLVVEVSGGMAVANGGGGGAAAGMSSAGPIVAFSRVSPVGRVDPSHPRMELASRPGSSTPRAPSPSTRGGQAQDPGRGSGIPRRDGGGGPGGQRTSAGVSRRNSSGDEPKVAVSDRVAKLLLAALDDTKASGASSSAAAAPPAAVERRKITATPKTACFDPPSVRNGLAGLTPGHVDNVLLTVEASTPGSVSCWKSPLGRRRPRSGGTDMLTPTKLGLGPAEELHSRRRRQLNLSHDSISWFDAEGSARGILQEVAGAQGAAGDGPGGARKKKGGGGARRKRSMLKVKLPPRTPRTPAKQGGNNGAIQAAPATTTRRKGSWGLEHVEWASIVDDDDEEADAGEDFTGNNPMYARPVETINEKNIQTRTLPAPPKRSFSFASRRTRGGRSSFSPSRSSRRNKTEGPSSYSPSRSGGRGNDEVHPCDSSLAATYARSTRRPVRAFQKMDEDVYDEFLNCTKKKPKGGRGVRRMTPLD